MRTNSHLSLIEYVIVGSCIIMILVMIGLFLHQKAFAPVNHQLRNREIPVENMVG